MLVSLEDLKRTCLIVFDKAIAAGFDEVEVNSDYYWIVPSEERKDMNISYPDMAVGSSNEDLESLQKVLDGDIPASIDDFNRLGNITIAVGDEIRKQLGR